MSTFVENVKVASATAGHLPPQSVAAAGTAAPTTAGYVLGSALLGRSLVAFVQTGAFTSTPSMAFKLSSATDANGTGVADVTGGEIATVAVANTAAAKELSAALINPILYYGIRCTATGGTSGFVAGQLRLLDPTFTA
ncbi:MAG: hypothetical protein IPO00_09700 [Betaproteobacteria bacterium]|nr:hypothetical protein [Betaproteobacteria bacterium]